MLLRFRFGAFARLAVFAGGLTVVSENVAFASDVPAPRKTVAEAALDIIRMEACRASWNFHVDSATPTGKNISSAEMALPVGEPFTLGGHAGTKYAYVSNALGNVEICGWYFVPGRKYPSPQGDTPATVAAEAQGAAITGSMAAFTRAGQDILNVIPPDGATGATPPPAGISFNPNVIAAVNGYEKALMRESPDPKAKPVNVIRTFPPRLFVDDSDRPRGMDGYWSWMVGQNGDEAWYVRKQVSRDMALFDYYTLPEDQP